MSDLMDNIDWWAVLNAPPQPEQPAESGFRGEAVNERHQANTPVNLVRPVGGTQDESNQDVVNFGRSRDSWQSREAELLTYLSQANNHPPLNGSHHQQQAHQQVQSETAFQGLPDWLFPPAINSGPPIVPTAPTFAPLSEPPHWTTYAEAPSLTRQDTQPQSTRGQSQGELRWWFRAWLISKVHLLLHHQSSVLSPLQHPCQHQDIRHTLLRSCRMSALLTLKEAEVIASGHRLVAVQASVAG